MKTLTKLVLDTIPVIFGVLIALFIGDWKKDLDDQRYMDRMIESMKEEAQVNFDDFDKIIPLHLRMIDTIDFYLEDPNISVLDLFVKNNGFKLPSVSNSTWTAVINNRIELVDIETLKILNGMDGLTELTSSKVKTITDFTYQNMNASSQESKETLKIHFLNLVESEIQLLLDHMSFLGIEELESTWMEDYEIDL